MDQKNVIYVLMEEMESNNSK